MASTTIHTLSYKMSVDSRAFTEGMTATRKELRAAGRIMKETRTPTQKLEEDLIELNRLYKLGAIDAQGYTKRLDQLEEQFKKTEHAADDTSTTMSSSAGSIAKWVGGFVAAKLSIDAVIGGLTTLSRMVNDQFAPLDALAKKSDEIGIDPVQLLRLERITELTSTFKGDQLDTALRKMTVRASQAAAGTGEAVATLEELNLNAAYLNTLAPEQQFFAIADAVRDVANESDQARLVMKLFDDEAIALVNTLRLGSDELQRQTEHIEGFTREELAAIEGANDAWTTFNAALVDAFSAIAVNVAPEIQMMAEQLTEMMNTDAFAVMLESALETAEALFPYMLYMLAKVESGFLGMQAAQLDARLVTAGLAGDAQEVLRLGQQRASVAARVVELKPFSSVGGAISESRARLTEIRNENERRANEIREQQLNAQKKTNDILERQRNEQPPAVVGGL